VIIMGAGAQLKERAEMLRNSTVSCSPRMPRVDQADEPNRRYTSHEHSGSVGLTVRQRRSGSGTGTASIVGRCRA
jgi:hypothetical protein